MKLNKLALIALTITLCSASAFANKICQDTGKLEDAAKKAFRGEKGAEPAGDGNDTFQRTTKNGEEDQWLIEMSVQEECLTGVIVYTKAGTCDVVKTPIEVGQRDCG